MASADALDEALGAALGVDGIARVLVVAGWTAINMISAAMPAYRPFA